MDNMSGWGPGFGWIFMVLFWALVIAGAIALIKRLRSGSSGTTPRNPTPLDILKERYARGDIDHEEYERKRTDLEK